MRRGVRRHGSGCRGLLMLSRVGARRCASNLAPVNKSGDPNRHVLALKGITKLVGSNRTLFKNIDLSFYHGAKIGVLGHNGSGKSSLLRIIGGVDTEYDGEVFLHEKEMKIGYLQQEPMLDEEKTVDGNILDGIRHKQDLLNEFERISAEFANEDADFDALVAKQAEIQTQIDDLDCWDLNHEVETARRALNCPPGDASVTNLSGGEKRRVAICRLALSKPDILLLDEPTNHLDAQSVRWLEKFLETYPGLVLSVTHDRYFLDNVAGWILEVDQGSVYPCMGNYSAWLKQRAERYELMGKREKARAKQMNEELQWIRNKGKGQAKKSKARQKRYQQLMDSQVDLQQEGGRIFFPRGPRLGDRIIEAKGISKSFEGRQIFKDLDFALHPGSIVGIIGPNGSGKSTLLNCLAGEEDPDTGSVSMGETVTLGYVSQHRDDMKENNKVWQEIVGREESDVDMGDGVMMNGRKFVAQFNFRGSSQEKTIGNLSGGERNRCHMAKVLKQGVNVLFLDEPTNDLDVDTLRALEESIGEFAGAVVIVSHDRWFLDRVCTEILEFPGDGTVVKCEGNYTTYQKNKAKEVESQWR
ncbi:hypothetical protein AAMO2058_001027500 [Amorphochlora amoebiformis]